jgi:hypothetical protein
VNGPGRAQISIPEGKDHALSLPVAGSLDKAVVQQIASGLNLPVGVAYRDASETVLAILT